mgnify:CR=1 FL=1
MVGIKSLINVLRGKLESLPVWGDVEGCLLGWGDNTLGLTDSSSPGSRSDSLFDNWLDDCCSSSSDDCSSSACSNNWCDPPDIVDYIVVYGIMD